MRGMGNLNGLGNLATSAAAGAAPDAEVTRNAIRALPPGHGSGTAIVAGNDTLYTYAVNNLVNLSGAPITLAKAVFMGWYMTNSGVAACGNDVSVSGFVVYPVGGTQYPFTATITNNGEVYSTDIAIAGGIPAGATFGISISSTVPTGQNRLTNNGFAGLCTVAMASTLKKESIFFMGDSIMTADSRYAGFEAANGKCPAVQMSIGGTRLDHYYGSAAKFVSLAEKLGATRFVSNYATNDFGGNFTFAQLRDKHLAFRDAARAAGIKYTTVTCLPQSTRVTVTPSAMTGTGTTITATVANSALFQVGDLVEIFGVSQSGYNGITAVIGVPNGTTVELAGTPAATPATGTFGLRCPTFWRNRRLTTPSVANSGVWAAGSGTYRAQYNAYVRAGNFDDFVEWANAVESGENTGLWGQQGDKPIYPANTVVTVSGNIAANRFNATYDFGANAAQGGLWVGLTGANAGQRGTLNSSTAGPTSTITASSNFPVLPVLGDTFLITAGGSGPTSDGIHPNNAGGGFGTQNAIIDVLKAKIDGWLA